MTTEAEKATLALNRMIAMLVEKRANLLQVKECAGIIEAALQSQNPENRHEVVEGRCKCPPGGGNCTCGCSGGGR